MTTVESTSCCRLRSSATTNRPAPTLPRAPGRNDSQKIYLEWLAHCKGGPTCLANFDYAGPLTEAILLGNVALRTGGTIQWDAAKLQAKGLPAADSLLRKEYSYGFGIGG